MRKMHLAMRASAMVMFPGGFGTMDELFEILTFVQTGKSPNVPIVLFDESYWRRMVNVDALLEEGMVSERDLSLLHFANTAEDAWATVARLGLKKTTPGEG